MEPGPSPFHLVLDQVNQPFSQVGPTHFIYDNQGVVVRVDGPRLVPEVALSKAIRRAMERRSGNLYFVSGSWPKQTYVAVQGVNPGPPSFSLYRGGKLRAAKLDGLGSVEPMGAWKGHPVFAIEDEPSLTQPWIFLDVRGQRKIAVAQYERSPLAVDTTQDGTLYYAGDGGIWLHRYPGDHKISLGAPFQARQIAAASAKLAFVLAMFHQHHVLLRVGDEGAGGLVKQPFASISSIDAQPDGTLWALAGGGVYRLAPGGSWTQVPLPRGIPAGSWSRVVAVNDDDVWLFGEVGVLRSIAPPNGPLDWKQLRRRLDEE